MRKMKLILNTVKEIDTFCKLSANQKTDVVVTKDRWVIDGKSFMGMMSLDCSTGFYVEIQEPITEDFFRFLNTYSC